MAHYKFVTTWRFAQPISRVWDAIHAAEDYPRWWPNVKEYRELTAQNRGVGARAEWVVKGFLPYRPRYTTCVTRCEAPHELAFDATGDLVGRARFLLDETAQGAQVVIDWKVDTQGRWLNRLAPTLRWLFVWNHDYVMDCGQRGLARWLQSSGGE